MNENCKHRRIKKNFPFGKKSNPRMYCKDCEKIIGGKELREIRESKKKGRRR